MLSTNLSHDLLILNNAGHKQNEISRMPVESDQCTGLGLGLGVCTFWSLELFA